jgi:putative FmdB family regulatory protein
MPIYDYSCEKCNHSEEVISQKTLTENDVKTCPKCGLETFKKIWTVGKVHSSFGLKGWGEGLSQSQRTNALLETGTIDGKRIL